MSKKATKTSEKVSQHVEKSDIVDLLSQNQSHFLRGTNLFFSIYHAFFLLNIGVALHKMWHLVTYLQKFIQYLLINCKVHIQVLQQLHIFKNVFFSSKDCKTGRIEVFSHYCYCDAHFCV